MTVPSEHVRQRVRQWASLADEDLRLAEYALTMESSCPYRLVAYHAQQCTEKYLKAYLVLLGVDFPFTHNISALLELCEPTAPWALALTQAEALTAYAVTARYPGLEQEVTAAEALEAIAAARQVRQTVRQDLETRGLTV